MTNRIMGLIPLVAMLSASMLATGCRGSRAAIEVKTELIVYAASSLVGAFAELEIGFEEANPGIDVKTTFAGSQVLRFQIEQGGPADIFASANQDHMEALVGGGQITNSLIFAGNDLVVIVPKANPAGIQTFADLGQATLIVLGSENVPVGAYTRQLLDNAEQHFGEPFKKHVEARTVSLENNVRLVRTKVEMGEADAAIVYRSEAFSPRLTMIPIPEKLNARVRYPIGVLARSENPSQARTFIDYLLSTEGVQTLSSHHFLAVQ